MAHISVTSPVGPLTLFEEDGALVALEWGQASDLASDLASDQGSSPVLSEAKTQLAAYFRGDLQSFDLPLSPAGTSFQQSVWKAMGAIPFGQTRTYGALAKDLNSAARAVGGACGRNPLPIVIPCHRVLSGSGLGGFSGGAGLSTKRALLRLEGALA